MALARKSAYLLLLCQQLELLSLRILLLQVSRIIHQTGWN
jgi:hypothetical protein